MCYNINTKNDLYRLEIEALRQLFEVPRKTFTLVKENIMAIKRTYHGGCGTRLYEIWNSMKKRCANGEKYKAIEVCEEWLHFVPFRDWSNRNGYDDSLTIDRINTHGNYDPLNCRWTTKTVQARNRKKTKNSIGYIGVRPNTNSTRYSAKIYVNNKHVYIGTYDTKKEAAMARDNYIISNGYEHTLNFERGT